MAQLFTSGAHLLSIAVAYRSDCRVLLKLLKLSRIVLISRLEFGRNLDEFGPLRIRWFCGLARRKI